MDDCILFIKEINGHAETDGDNDQDATNDGVLL